MTNKVFNNCKKCVYSIDWTLYPELKKARFLKSKDC
jgi:hypothetical protein